MRAPNLLIGLLLVPLVFSARADEPREIPQQAIDQLTSDLEELHQSIAQANDEIQLKQSLESLRSAVKVTVETANVRAGAAESAQVISRVHEGMSLPVIDKAGEWYAVEVASASSGVNTGWISAEESIPVIPDSYRMTMDSRTVVSKASYTSSLYRMFTEKAVSFRDRYSDNPYVSVDGFTVNVGIPPSLSLSFQFEEEASAER